MANDSSNETGSAGVTDAALQVEFLTTREAGERFPVPISPNAVLHRMNHGIGGIKLECRYDGYRYTTTAEWIDEFIRKCTESRGKSPVVERLDDTSVARFKALIRRKRVR